MPTPEHWLLAIVALGFSVEGTLGFGATVIAVALGSLLVPIDRLLPAFVPLNMCLSAYLGGRYRHEVRWDLLLRRVLPAMLAGLPLGLFAFARVAAAPMKLAFGLFVIVLSAIELGRAAETDDAPGRPLSRTGAVCCLALGGVIHGAFGTGGPLAVYVLGREPTTKAGFRATLSALWLTLNTVLVGSYVALGKVDASSLRTTAYLAVSLVAGLGLGELLHDRVPARVFRKLVFVMLAVAGMVLAARAYR
jgi:uncharacterized membrane protein YfcA